MLETVKDESLSKSSKTSKVESTVADVVRSEAQTKDLSKSQVKNQADSQKSVACNQKEASPEVKGCIEVQEVRVSQEGILWLTQSIRTPLPIMRPSLKSRVLMTR